MQPRYVPIIIPARSGSVGVPGKNIKLLGGKPLLAWAIEAAKGSQLADRVIVDTDSEEYAKIARQWGAETPYLRPKELAEDVPSEDVLIHAVGKLLDTGYFADAVACVQCTTPLIDAQDIDDCIGPVLMGEADSAITLKRASEVPSWMFVQDRDGLIYSTKEASDQHFGLRGQWGVRQNWGPIYHPNGGCYVVRSDLLLEKQQIIVGKCKGVVMPKLKSIDIDSPEDFLLLEALLKAGYLQGRE